MCAVCGKWLLLLEVEFLKKCFLLVFFINLLYLYSFSKNCLISKKGIDEYDIQK